MQLDVFGPLVDLVFTLQATGGKRPARLIGLVEGIVDGVDVSWREPDHGIWRSGCRRPHHIDTKVMCWLVVGGRSVSETTAARYPRAGQAMDAIVADVLTQGWNEDVGRFVSRTAARARRSVLLMGSPD